MTPEDALEEIYSSRFESRFAKALRKTSIPTDGAKVVVADKITEEVLQNLIRRKVVAIHIPGYCSEPLANRAARDILKMSKITNWVVPDGKKGIQTDMNFSIGYPLQMIRKGKFEKQKYKSGALAAIRKLRAIFSPHLSPMDRLRLELDEIWPHGASIQRFEDIKSSVGLVRVMKPETLFEGVAGVRGVCHIDSPTFKLQFSANTYLKVPDDGGELCLWNIALNKGLRKNPLYNLIHSNLSLDPQVQTVIHALMPKPLIIKPKPGDLVILDTSRPHAVRGFKKGCRISIQAFITTESLEKPVLSFYS